MTRVLKVLLLLLMLTSSDAFTKNKRKKPRQGVVKPQPQEKEKIFKIFQKDSFQGELDYVDCSFKTNGELFLLQQVIKPGAIIFDVGANVGEWSLSALKIQPSIHLTAFEPVPALFKELEENLHSYPDVGLKNIAVSDETGGCTFYYYSERPDLTGLSGLYVREVLKGVLKDPEILDLRQETLPCLCSELSVERIDFLKIDTEGAEWKVLKGAEALLKEHRIGAIQFEYGGCYLDAQTTLEQVFQLLTENDYLVFRIIPEGLIHIPQWEGSLENYLYSNYFAVIKDEFSRYFPTHSLK